MKFTSMKRRVVVFPLPIAGHIIPMLHLSMAIISQEDMLVTFVTTPRKRAEVLQSLSRIYCCWDQQLLEIVTIDDGLGDEWSCGTGPKVVEEVMFSILEQQGEFESLLEELLAREPIACIISDFLMDWTQDTARKFSVPRAAFWTSSSTYLLLLHSAPELFSDGCIPVSKVSHNKFVPSIKGVPELRTSELPYSFHAELPGDPEFQWAAKSIKKQLRGADWIMMNTFDELEKEGNLAVRELTQRFVALGPLLPASLGREMENPPAALEWLDNKEPESVLYVSFGSLASLGSLQQLQDLAAGLEASKQSFLWVVRDNLVGESCSEFLEKFKARTAGHCLIVPWAPQLQVLEHSAVGGFLTHCGWNSILESIWTGVPMLGWPRMVEQNINCKFVVDIWKVGLGLQSLESDKVSCSVINLMQGKDGKVIRDNVAKFRTASKGAAWVSERNLQAFLQTLK